MSEDELLQLVDSGESTPDATMRALVTVMARAEVERRKWRRALRWAVPTAISLALGGGFGVVQTVPTAQPVIVPAQVETVALSVEERLDVVEPRVQDNGESLRSIEDMIVDGVEWAGDAMTRKRGKPLPDLPPSLQRRTIDERRKSEAMQRAR